MPQSRSWLAWLRRPEVGAVAAFWPHLARKDRSRWLELILSSGSHLLIVAVLAVILLPGPSSVPLDRRGLAAVLVAYALYSLVLAVVARAFRQLYDKPVFRLSRILISTGLISFVVWFSSGNASYFWFFYSLPLLQATLYLDATGVRTVAVLVTATYWAVCIAFAAASQPFLDFRPVVMNSFALAILTFTFYWLFGSARARQLLNQRQLGMLNHLNEKIRLSPGFDETLQIVLREALRAVNTDEGSVMVFDAERKRLEIRTWLAKGQPVPKTHRSFGLDEGIAGYVATTGHPHNCADVGKDPHFLPSPDDRPIRSLLSVPVVSHGKVICILNVDHEQPGYFQEDDVRLLKILAGNVAIALESHRLRDVGLFLSTLTEDELCAKIVESACLLIGTESSSIFLLDPKTRELRSAATYPPNLPVLRPRSTGLTRMVIDSGKPLRIDDVQADSRVKDAIKESGVRSLLCCPLTVRAGGPQQPAVVTIGTVFVRSHELRVFNRRDEELLQSLANQAAIALENARIRADLEEHVQFLESLVANTSDAIVVLDTRGFVTGLNTAAETILGYSHGELFGKSVDQIYYELGTAREVKKLLLERGGRLVNHESAIRGKDGTKIPIQLSVNLLPNGTVGFFGDLRKVIESTHQHIAQLEALYLASIGVIDDLDIEAVLQRLVDGGCRLTGARYGALGLVSSGGSLHPFITSGLTAEERERLGSPPRGRGLLGVLLEENQALNLRDVTQDPRFGGWPDGHPRITSFLGVPIGMKGKPPIGNLYVANKIVEGGFSRSDELALRTQATLAAISIERAQAHEEANASKAMGVTFALLSQWAHMVRQKNFALQEDLRTLRLNLPRALYDDILENMSESIRALGVPSRRLEEMELKEPVEIGALLKRIVRERCKRTDVAVQPSFAIAPGGYVAGNRLLLEFAVDMLVANAMDSIAAGGRPGRLRARCEVQPPVVLITLSDNGIGIPPEIQRDLYRAPVKSDKGFGHGAMTAAFVIKAHRGDIRLVESTPEGTTVQFWLPVAGESQEALPA